MSTLAFHATATPEKAAAVIAETGASLNFRQLHQRSAALAQHLAGQLEEGGVVALLLTNRLEYFEACFAARRAGLYYVPISTHLTAAEMAHILEDSGASLLITEQRFASALERLSPSAHARLQFLWVDGTAPDHGPCYAELAAQPVQELPQRRMGLDFTYSSGTTGKPKGIRHAMAGDPALTAAVTAAGWTTFFQLDAASVYLSPAPLYHAAPLRFAIRCIAAGGTVVCLQKFDAEGALRAMEQHGVTHSQWVPTMFIRLLALPEAVRQRYPLAAHQIAMHAAAPCPVEVKHKMLAWWGPVIWEYYTGSERAGATVISPQDWLTHPGSVGRAAQGTLRIVNDEGQECPPGVDGLVCFEGGPRFQYHNDPAKTKEAHTPQGWATFGDIGHVDADGFLYLTDRRANMIISGGVNIYPQEAENRLLLHPLVRDVAVIGVPHAEFGEEVKAVVELHDPALADAQTEALLLAFCREHLSTVKCPRSVDFAQGLPRSETGKLLKRLIRDDYRAAASSTSS